ncbi:GGDEF domain-containing protein [Tamaricihabitans halophyticus]|uniref:GGDEF domain-containing protein n=1 Tax=Tamaricihabitans halophyticus TaxID=1262583 RepID=UPI0014052737|nr:GGDEF domain-containing protein [Tamaricihabitans halophyticus]
MARQDRANQDLIRLHESIAGLLAARQQWREAYAHLRSALDLLQRDREAPEVPEQFRREVDQLRREHAEACEQSIRDSLTDSYNRRYLDQRLVSLLTEQNIGSDGLSVALVDLDWFKQVNDDYGHLTGDRVLKRVAKLLRVDLPDDAFCARYGGEEFVLVLPGLDDAAALRIAEAARARVAEFPWHTIVANLRVTVSIGLAESSPPPPPPDDTHSPAMTPAERQLLRADDLLYAAKRAGRNAVAYCEGGTVRLAGDADNRRLDPSQLAM